MSDMQAIYSARAAAVVTPSDTVNFAPTRLIYVGSAGTLQLVFLDNSVVPFKAPEGAQLSVRVKRVNATGTTAADIVALY